MRMFLVCMCDIFLILYLTNLGQVNRDAVSDLTVGDYLALKKIEQQLKDDIKQQKEQLGLLGKELGKAKEDLVFKISVLKEKERELSDRKFAEYKFSKKLETKEEQAKRLEQRYLAEQRAKEKAEELREEALKRMEGEKVKALEEERLRKQKEEELKQARAALEREREQLEEQKKRAKQLAKKKEEAERLKLKAEVNLKVSRSHMKVARQKAKEAQQEAQVATQIAIDSKAKAAVAEQQAEVALIREEKAKEVLSTVIAPKEEAYTANVKDRIASVSVISKSENVLLGSSEDAQELKGVITSVFGTQVIFVPRVDSGIPDLEDVDRAEQYSVSIAGAPVTKLLLLPGESRVVGLLVPERKALRLPQKSSDSLVDGLMPTLFAIRNQGPRNLSDRIRGLSEDFFVFKRERLEVENPSTYRYKADGFRGTGDFGERIITGDTVVDFAGEVIAIAESENSLVKIDKNAGWQILPIAGLNAEEAFRNVWKVIGKN